MARKTTSTKKSSTPQKSVVRTRKSTFSFNTLVTVILLATLIGFAFYLNREKKTKEAEATPAGQAVTFVFDALDGMINSIQVSAATGETVKVTRNEKNVWALEMPIKAEANQSWVESAASQVSFLQVMSPIPADGDPTIFGFDSPEFVITIRAVDGKTHTLEIGDMTPSQNGYYVRLDKNKMMIVDVNEIDSLTQFASYPPYLNTPTPSPLPPTETPVSPTDGAPTQEVSVTPAP